MRSALPWVGAEAAANLLYGLGMIAVIGWLIAPADLGAASVSIATILLIEAITSAGLQESVIRAPSADTLTTDTAFTSAVGLSLVGMLVALSLAVPIARIEHDARIVPLIMTASLMLPLDALDAIPLGIMMRKMRAAQLTRRQLVSKLVSFTVIVMGGFLKLGPWAVVLASVAVPVVSFFNIFLMLTRYPRLRWDAAIFRKLVSFGFAISAENACWALMTRAFTLLFSFYHGLAAVGAFQFGVRLVDEVANLIKLMVVRLGLSAFASLNRSGGNIGQAFQNGTRLLNAAAAPIFVGLAMLAPTIVPILFARRWIGAVPYIQIFALAWMLAMPRILVSPALRAVGRQYLQLAYAAASASVVLIAGLLIGHLSPFWAAMAFASRQVVAVPWGAWTMRRQFGLGLAAQVQVLLPALGSAALMAVGLHVVIGLRQHWSIAMLVLPVAGGAMVYAIAMLLLDRRTIALARRYAGRRAAP